MQYLSVVEIAEKWKISERSVRNYCAHNRVEGTFITGKTWNIPENAEKPERTNKRKVEPITLLDILKEKKAGQYSGGIYHKTHEKGYLMDMCLRAQEKYKGYLDYFRIAY